MTDGRNRNTGPAGTPALARQGPPLPKARRASRVVSPALVGLWALALVVSGGQDARAGVTMATTTFDSGGIRVDATYNGNTIQTYAGSFSTYYGNDSGNSFLTYCIDLVQTLATTQSTAVVSITDTSNYPDKNSNTRNIGAAGWVFNNYANASLSTLQSLSSPSLTAAQGRAAIQLAIWEATFDSGNNSGSGNLTGGNLTFTGTAANNTRIQQVVNGILGARGTQTSMATVIDYPVNSIDGAKPLNQDQIAAVPEPSPLLLGLLAGGPVALVGYLRRRGGRDRSRPKPARSSA